ncbi:MAG TPA: DinB family protein [Bryobacteraceae bacterium]|nr:DinB family protein [Bryobacteraceae bacterium]
MPVSADTLRQQLDYSAWASQRLLDEANKLNAEELTRDFKTADKSVLETLVHVFAADRIWLARVQGTARASFIDPQDRDLAVLNQEWPALQQTWKQYTASLSDQDVLKVISYRDTKGNAYQQPLWQILLHLVNHGTHHRGQVSGFLRSMGHPPPVLDLMAYYRAH